MKKQIIFIKGGIAKENYKNFIDYLEKIEFDPYKEKTKKWSDNFLSDLGNDFEIIEISRPNKDFADYFEWKIMFEKVFPYLKKDFILVGHSLGAAFLLKYFSENNFDFNFKNIFLLATPYKDSDLEKLGSFYLENKKKYLFEEKTIFLHSKDDFLVPFSDFIEFKNIFKKAKFIEFENKNHFLDEKFSEFLDLIKNI